MREGGSTKKEEQDMSMKQEDSLMQCKSPVDGEAERKLVVGTTGRSYRGREVVVCVFPPGLFGTRAGGRERRVECTLHNGLLNQCSFKAGRQPTPYWAVIDAMISLKKGFARRDVMGLAVEAVGEGKRRACEMAWDILRNHHRHDRKKNAGMALMVEDGEDGKLLVRARDEGETMQYFEAQKGRKKAAVVAEAGQAAPADGQAAPAVEPVADLPAGG